MEGNSRFSTARAAWCRSAWRATLVLVVAGMLGTAAAVERHDLSTERIQPVAPPAWLQPVAFDPGATLPADEVQDGVAWLLWERQTRLDGANRVSFRRLVQRATTAEGVDRISTIEVEFDPTYETLRIHALRLHRQGRVEDRLKETRVRYLQREPRLEARIYDGRRSAAFLVDDVRVGDTIEFAYSRSGANPVFGGREMGVHDLQWRRPIHHLFERLSVPRGRTVEIRGRRTALQPQQADSPGHRDYVWDLHRVPALKREPRSPEWFDPAPLVEWTEFHDWADVARWATLRFVATPDRAVRAEAERIAAPFSDPAERAAAIFRFVQGEIRYLGIEMGEGSHAPRGPAETLHRRYGDCKDKSVLAVAMLRAVGIDAVPALVHTTAGRQLDEQMPSPTAFNHAIVHVRLGGRGYWLDATRPAQAGTLARMTPATFHRALLVEAGSAALTPMPGPDSTSARELVMSFDVRAGVGQPASLTVKTKYEGSEADDLRESLDAVGRDGVARRYLQFYADWFDDIAAAGPLEFEDDASTNRIVVTERYTLPHLWQNPKDGPRGYADLAAPDVMSALPKAPGKESRTAPLAVQHPENLTVILEARLPGDWSVTTGDWSVVDPAFRFRRQVEYGDRLLTVRHDYRSLVDHVEPGRIAEFADHVVRMRSSVGYKLRLERAEPSSEERVKNLALFGAGIALVVVLAVHLLRLFRRHADTPAPTWPL